MQTPTFQQNTTEKSKYQRQRSSRWVTILKQYKWSRDHLIGQLIQYYHRVKWLFGKEMDCMWADEELSTWSNLITKQIISMYRNEWYAMDTKEELLIRRKNKMIAFIIPINVYLLWNRIDAYKLSTFSSWLGDWILDHRIDRISSWLLTWRNLIANQTTISMNGMPWITIGKQDCLKPINISTIHS